MLTMLTVIIRKNMNDTTDVVILAAGKGVRMQSPLPKALVKVVGVPLIERVVSSVRLVSDSPTIVVGHKKEEVMEYMGSDRRYITQEEQLGTGDALRTYCETSDSRGENLLVLPGDHPFIGHETLARFVESHESGAEDDIVATVATVVVPAYTGPYNNFYRAGRILRDTEGNISSIVEFRECTEEEKKIREVNAGYYCFRRSWLCENILKLTNDNNSKEFYLTDLVAKAISRGKKVRTYLLPHPIEAMGVNTPEELAVAEDFWRISVVFS